jgi:outer membrane protein assembly factor BamB
MSKYLFFLLCLSGLCTEIKAQNLSIFEQKNQFKGLKEDKKIVLKAQYDYLSAISRPGFEDLFVACKSLKKSKKAQELEIWAADMPIGWSLSAMTETCHCGVWQKGQGWIIQPSAQRLFIFGQLQGRGLFLAAPKPEMPLQEAAVYLQQDNGPYRQVLNNQKFDPHTFDDLLLLSNDAGKHQPYVLSQDRQGLQALGPSFDECTLHSGQENGKNNHFIWGKNAKEGMLYTVQGKALLPQPVSEVRLLGYAEFDGLWVFTTNAQGQQLYQLRAEEAKLLLEGIEQVAEPKLFMSPHRIGLLLNRKDDSYIGHWEVSQEKKKIQLSLLKLPKTIQHETKSYTLFFNPLNAGKTTIDDPTALVLDHGAQGSSFYLPSHQFLATVTKWNRNGELNIYGFDPQHGLMAVADYQDTKSGYALYSRQGLVLDKIHFSNTILDYPHVANSSLIYTTDSLYGLFDRQTKTWFLEPQYLVLRPERLYDLFDETNGNTLLGEGAILVQEKDGQWKSWKAQTKVFEPLPKLGDQLSLMWKQKIGLSTFRTNIMLEGGRIWLGSNGLTRDSVANDSLDGLYALDPKTGKVLLKLRPQPKGDDDVNGLATDGQRFFWGTDLGQIFCADAKGNILWKYAAKGDIEGSPVLADLNGDQQLDAVFAVEKPAEILALDGKDGKLLWRFSLAQSGGSEEQDENLPPSPPSEERNDQPEGKEPYFMATPQARDLNKDGIADVLIGSAGLGTLYALDGRTGQLLWSHEMSSGIHGCAQIVPFEAGKEAILINPTYGPAQWFSFEGELLRQVSTPIGNFSSPVMLSDSLLIQAQSWFDGSLTIANCFEEEKVTIANFQETIQNKHVSWLTTEKISASALLGDPFNKGQQQALIPTEKGLLYVFEANGRLAQLLQLPAGAEASLFMADVDGDGQQELLLAGLDGFLYCYKTPSKTKALWGQFRGNNSNTGSLPLPVAKP